LGIEFSIETQHAAMFMPFNPDWPLFAAAALIMRDFYRRHEQDLKACLGKTRTPIDIFAMQKISFIQWPYSFQS
jgi:hypothetical protein